MSGSDGAGAAPSEPAAVERKLLIDACRLRPTPRTPVWLMRQAGRYLPEYRRIREKNTLLEICAQPELAAEVTLQPIERFGMDAAIIFADILLPLVPLGVGLSFAAGEGPVISNGVETAADVDRLGDVAIEEAMAPTLHALRLVRSALPSETALIGFAGAPFTLASYLIEGGTSRRFVRMRSFMYREPAAFQRLMGKLARLTAAYLVAQAGAGADVVQLFDSWVGWLGPEDYRDHVLRHSAAVFDAVRATGVPAIHFGVGTTGILHEMRDAGGDVIGLDWRVSLTDGWRRVGHDRGVQGNIDPVTLLGPVREVERRARALLAEAGGRPGHIFNLGHGVLPATPPASVQALVDTVRAWRNRS